MKGLKVTLLVFVCLALTNCKVKFNENEDVIKVEDEGSYYVGDVESIRYYRGGWMVPAHMPNYSIDLRLEVTNAGKIKAVLDTPECKLSGKLNPNQYSNLANMIEEADATRKTGSGLDGGSETVTLEVDGDKENYHLSRAEYLTQAELHIEAKAAKEIRELLLKIADKLKEKYGCEGTVVDSKIKVLHFTQTLLNQVNVKPYAGVASSLGSAGSASSLGSAGAANFYNPGNSIKRDFKIHNDNGVLKVSGSEKITIGSSFCSRSLLNQVIDADIIKEMELIQIQHQREICMMLPLGDTSTSIRLTYQDGESEIGYQGCWNTQRLSNHSHFMDKFLKWLEKQDQACGAYAAMNE